MVVGMLKGMHAKDLVVQESEQGELVLSLAVGSSLG